MAETVIRSRINQRSHTVSSEVRFKFSESFMRPAMAYSDHYCLQLNSVRGCPDKLLPAVPRKWHFLDSQQTGGNQNINILLDRTPIPIKAMCYSSYGRWLRLSCTKQLKPCWRHHGKHIARVFESENKFRRWHLTEIHFFCELANMCKKFFSSSCFYDHVAH